MKRIWPAILLAWIAGFVDSLGYLALDQIFTAHMSGNSAAVGAELGIGNWHEAMIRGLVIPAFVLGIAVGTTVQTLIRQSRLRAQLAPAFLLEILLLLSFLLTERGLPETHPLAGSLDYFIRVWLLAIAMGVQSAALRRAAGTRVRTTYISGMLTDMAENAVLSLFQLRRRRSRSPTGVEPIHDRSRAGRAVIFGLIFLSFLVGGICGGFGEVRWGSVALVAPVTVLMVLALQDWFITPLCRRS